MLKMPSYLTDLEAEITSGIVEGFPLYTGVLMAQLAQSTLESRDYNGYGFYTTVAIAQETPSCALFSGRLHASAHIGGELCGFMLWIREGKIDFLEGYPLGGDAWPVGETITAFVIGDVS
jgi:hypothetical protein